MEEEKPSFPFSAKPMQGISDTCKNCNKCTVQFKKIMRNQTEEKSPGVSSVIKYIKAITALLECEEKDILHTEMYAPINLFFKEMFESEALTHLLQNTHFTKQMERFIYVLQAHNNQTKQPERKIQLPVILWKPVPFSVEGHPAEHNFQPRNPTTSIETLSTEICSKLTLRHATSSTQLALIFSGDNDIVLKVNPNNDSNISSSGLLFCGFNINFDDIGRPLPRYVFENRYGSCVIKFPAPFFGNPNVRFFKLGTKKYKREFCQAVLVDLRDVHKNYNVLKWDDIKIHNCEELTNWQNWDVQYEMTTDGNWTNPEFVFPHDITIPKSACKIEFVDHRRGNCPQRKECFDCKCRDSESLSAIMHTNGEVEDVTFHCDEEYNLPDEGIDRVIMIFALSIEPIEREGLKELQKLHSVFRDDHFAKIESNWRNYEISNFNFGPF